MPENYRKLTESEIETLVRAGCRAVDWNDVLVISQGFDASKLRQVSFRGYVSLGSNSGTVTKNGTKRDFVIENSVLENVSIGDNCHIRNTGTITGYNIGSNVIIAGGGDILCNGTSSFGNGVYVKTLNEAGGREVPIYEHLTAQTAYLMAMYRHRKSAVRNLSGLIENYAAELNSDRCSIGDGVSISNYGRITNVRIGEGAVISGAHRLENGTLVSIDGETVNIGPGVVASDFICRPGSVIGANCELKRCFVGEAVRIESGFTAADSLFFANSELAAGEAVSVFAGPYTVSHHKSSLLIAGYFLFFNAGSGSNQSNHLFKTGPVHQGIHERGCKFASNAYVMLPAREGVFNTVIGRHTSHHDTSDFPYSYLIEDAANTFVMPGAGLKSYGTMRDLAKWPEREKRQRVRTDRIHFDQYNPYIGSRLLRGLELCRELSAKQADIISYNRLRIKKNMLKKGEELYSIAIEALLGAMLRNVSDDLSGTAFENLFGEELDDRLSGTIPDRWIDIAGMYASGNSIDGLIGKIESGYFKMAVEIEAELDTVFNSYKSEAVRWALSASRQYYGTGLSVGEIVDRGTQAAVRLETMRLEDAKKDNDSVMKVSYGIDARSPEDVDGDFEAVRIN